MPIPAFDHNNVLPPHVGDPTNRSDLSPYECNVIELCKHYGTSPQRIAILKGFLAFRLELNRFGIVNGFQWIDGSFTENIEASERRQPNDIDVVTFYGGIDANAVVVSFPEFADPTLSKSRYAVDHYPVDYMFRPDVTVEQTRYWLQLFTHNRSGVWKGILKLALNTPHEDQDALNYLNAL
jgi:hypothetical protein